MKCNNCHKCLEGVMDEFETWRPKASMYMILCTSCGNKRCPKASDHELECTNINDSGQPGSIYK